MTDDDLIRLLHTEGDRLPRETADAIVARGAAIAPRLAEIVARRRSWQEEGDAGWAPIHATFLLGAIGGPDAVNPLLDALRFSCEEDIDWVYDALPDILGSIGPPALDALRRLAEDASAETHPRLAACDALREMAFRHPFRKEAIADALRSVAESRTAPLDVRGAAGLLLMNLAQPRDRALLEALAREQEHAGEIDWFDPNDVKEAYRGTPPFKPVPNEQDWMEFYDPDAIAGRQERWAEEAFEGDDAPEDDLDAAEDDEDGGEDAGPPPRPIVNAESAPGRNDPCPCGSGKKYKKCCGKGP